MLNLHYFLFVSVLVVFAVDVSIARNMRDSEIPSDLRAGVATFTGPTYGGQVFFTPTIDEKLQVTGTITGLPANKSLGVHIHGKGNLDNACLAAGGHWNPFNKNHGSLTSAPRHEGDLGNIATNANGDMTFDLTMTPSEDDPTQDYIGLALVVHSGTDDLGLADNEGSRTTGNSGSRLTCAVIGLKDPPAAESHGHRSARYDIWTHIITPLIMYKLIM